MSNPQPPTVADADTDIAHELREIGEEFGCPRLQGENTAAYAMRVLECVSEMRSELSGVESRVRELLATTDRSQ
jgi:hypothetical protein